MRGDVLNKKGMYNRCKLTRMVVDQEGKIECGKRLGPSRTQWWKKSAWIELRVARGEGDQMCPLRRLREKRME